MEEGGEEKVLVEEDRTEGEKEKPEEEGKAEVEENPPPTAEAEEEEAKPPPSIRGREKEEEFVEERIYTIPLGKAWIAPPKKRAPRAMQVIKAFIKRHMKLEATKGEEEEEPKKLTVRNEVNEMVWRRGISKPPRKIRVRAAKDEDGNVTVYLAEGD